MRRCGSVTPLSRLGEEGRPDTSVTFVGGQTTQTSLATPTWGPRLVCQALQKEAESKRASLLTGQNNGSGPVKSEVQVVLLVRM